MIRTIKDIKSGKTFELNESTGELRELYGSYTSSDSEPIVCNFTPDFNIEAWRTEQHQLAQSCIDSENFDGAYRIYNSLFIKYAGNNWIFSVIYQTIAERVLDLKNLKRQVDRDRDRFLGLK